MFVSSLEIRFAIVMQKAFKHIVTLSMLLLCMVTPYTTQTIFAASTKVYTTTNSSIGFTAKKQVTAHICNGPYANVSDFNNRHRHLIENENEEFECTSSKKYIDQINSAYKLLYDQSLPYLLLSKKSLRNSSEDFSFFKATKPPLFILFEVFRI